ncbi:MAG TPA: ubiquinone-binding protein [Gammaproteobacteria bacterium]|jgi:ribosome-associated toxin RatA of RatAB toxin-antitoxin module|nr:type II toxin-antitoxin system RatA family toxin [Gammaproteobacteria bacterium]MDP6733750.1 type II toxin-antitoxin system RatA family toxin [Gammaproteobacteria bacterium]HAJ75604.1 ubiquinone-binding protein [Gammaproteobacteria bacterium]|tara:strand:- start:1404 stop:1835 length:432 start_codon:yes stop_codon:yes gene_type:complete
MITIQRSALVNYSVEQMFDLVNDIEQYPNFMQGCTSASVKSQSEGELVGELCLSKAGVSHCFTTRNVLQRPESIDMNLVKGNFSNFSAVWTFGALTESACKVSLAMDFEFKSGLMDFAAKKLFSSSANNLVDALVGRAQQVYG